MRAVTVVVVALALVSSLTYVRNWQTSNLTEPYFDQVRAGLRSAEHQPVPLVDASLPQTLLWAFGFPENTYSHVFRDQARLTDYPDWSVDELYIFDDGGHLRPVVIQAARSMVPGSGAGTSWSGTSRRSSRWTGPSSAAGGGSGWATRAHETSR
ncbi:MAG: hypothetical protein R2734_10675 [Nocardioides sp.]